MSFLSRQFSARAATRGAIAAVAALFMGMTTAFPVTTAVAQTAADKATQTNYDVIMFKDGKTVQGIILSETATVLKVRVSVAGITAETEYPKSQILEIKRGAGAAIGGSAAPASTTPSAPATPATPASGTAPVPASLPSATAPTKTGGVYWITLAGKFGQDITETPIRDSFRDAKQYHPDIIVIEVDNVVELKQMGIEEATPEMEKLFQSFDEIFRAEKFLRVPLEEVPSEWSYTPRIVYWVKRALGGVAFMPLTGKEIYFAPDGKLGGVGSIERMIGHGHRRVVEKQLSLRLGHAIGWVNHSGYPQPELLTRGLVKKSCVLSVRFEDGRPVLFEGYPSNPSEELLTDDGEEGNADDIQQVARGLGNDVLTLDQRTAKLIGLSKGTVATKDELLSALGVSHDALIDGRSERIMKDWSKGIENQYNTLQRIAREFQEIQVQGDFNERRAARAARISKLEQMKSIGMRWNEGLDPYRLSELRLPAGENGLDLAYIQQTIDNYRLQQSLDRR